MYAWNTLDAAAVTTSRERRRPKGCALAVPVIVLAGLTAAGESAAQPATETPHYPALCRPSNAKIEILSPTGWTIKVPPGQDAATIQYVIKVSPGVTDPKCAEHYPHWLPAGWTLKTLFGRAKGGEGEQQKSEFEFKDVADFAWQASGTVTLGAGQWTMLSQVVLPELGASKTIKFTIEQDEANGPPPKISKTERRSPRKRVRPGAEGPGGKGDTGDMGGWPGGKGDAGEMGGGPGGRGDTGDMGGGPGGTGDTGEMGGGPNQILQDLLSKVLDKILEPKGARNPTGDAGPMTDESGAPSSLSKLKDLLMRNPDVLNLLKSLSGDLATSPPLEERVAELHRRRPDPDKLSKLKDLLMKNPDVVNALKSHSGGPMASKGPQDGGAKLKIDPKTLKNVVKVNPDSLKVGPSVTTNPSTSKRVVKVQPSVVKVPADVKSRTKKTNTQKVSVRPAMVCDMRRVGTKMRRICIRRR